ncbi:MAG: electron transfer flavoprotein subunit alpha/FixB family protein [Deltaproteobacteria bacterium]|nr:electron transfer flavoprotein subunit alpha/FixB family protein [Deltaproteobacteria bacterium]
MSIWVVCEAQEKGFRQSTLELLAQARRLSGATGAKVVAVAIGDEGARVESLRGAAHRVVTVKGKLSTHAPESLAGALAGVLQSEKPRLVLFGEGTRTRELLPRLAARLGGAALTNGLGLEADGDGFAVTRPVLGGKAYATCRCGERLCLAAFRPNSFDPSAEPVAETSFETVEVEAAPSRVEILEQRPRESKRAELTEAGRVVAAGRGLRAPENLRLVEELADALGGAVGVSRAIVDAGWADHAIQVGKSGKTISPALYIVAGVSGAVHHTMGMDTAKVVVAINTDPTAPIFQYADYGLVGDALQVLPAITAEVKLVAG